MDTPLYSCDAGAPQFLPQVVEIGLGVSFPLSISIEEIGIIEYPPVTHLCSFGLVGA